MSDQATPKHPKSASDAFQKKLESVFTKVETLDERAKDHWKKIEEMGKQLQQLSKATEATRDAVGPQVNTAILKHERGERDGLYKPMRDILRIITQECPNCHQGNGQQPGLWELVSYPPIKIRCTGSRCGKVLELPADPEPEVLEG